MKCITWSGSGTRPTRISSSRTSNPSTLVLARGELTSIQHKGGRCQISCDAGRLWVTVSGNWEDFVLAPGEELTFEERSKIVVEALRAATVRIQTLTIVRQAARSLFPFWRLSAGLSQ